MSSGGTTNAGAHRDALGDMAADIRLLLALQDRHQDDPDGALYAQLAQHMGTIFQTHLHRRAALETADRARPPPR